MKLTRSLLVVAAVTSAVTGLGSQPAVQAAPTSEAEPTVMRLIPVRNVGPEVLASWLDPDNHPSPTEIKTPYLWAVGAGIPHKPAGKFGLPTGVKSINPLAQKGGIMVIGTTAGIGELEKTIATLDVPYKQVEIETQFISVTPENSKAFGIDFSPAFGNGLQIGYVRSNFQPTLSQLLEAKKSKLITAPRFTANSEMETKITSSLPQPVMLGYKNADGQFHALPASALQKEAGQAQLESSQVLAVVPTVNVDDTVTMAISFTDVLRLSGPLNDDSKVLGAVPGLKAVMNVRDGDTVALAGFSPEVVPRPLAGVLGEGPKTLNSPMVVAFVTARIIRRVSDLKIDTIALRK